MKRAAIKGYAWAAGSLLLVTLAQLLMKWGMQQLPHPALTELTPMLATRCGIPLLAVACGIGGYALSMLCWFNALLYLPLSLAYPLLSISYVLVYLGAILLPGFNESATAPKTLGVVFILLGVGLINKNRPK